MSHELSSQACETAARASVFASDPRGARELA
jgi:hypothetical protein